MFSTLRRLRARHLLAGWALYWLALALITLGPAYGAIRRVTAPGGHGSMHASMDDGVLSFTVSDAASTVWRGAAGIGSVVFWIVLPPLVMWLIWVLTRPQRRTDTATPPDDAVMMTEGGRALDPPQPDWSAPSPAKTAPSRGREPPA